MNVVEKILTATYTLIRFVALDGLCVGWRAWHTLIGGSFFRCCDDKKLKFKTVIFSNLFLKKIQSCTLFHIPPRQCLHKKIELGICFRYPLFILFGEKELHKLSSSSSHSSLSLNFNYIDFMVKSHGKFLSHSAGGFVFVCTLLLFLVETVMRLQFSFLAQTVFTDCSQL
jgi:hypothetical protein